MLDLNFISYNITKIKLYKKLKTMNLIVHWIQQAQW